MAFYKNLTEDYIENRLNIEYKNHLTTNGKKKMVTNTYPMLVTFPFLK